MIFRGCVSALFVKATFVLENIMFCIVFIYFKRSEVNVDFGNQQKYWTVIVGSDAMYNVYVPYRISHTPLVLKLKYKQ